MQYETCDRCGAPIKNICSWNGLILGSECVKHYDLDQVLAKKLIRQAKKQGIVKPVPLDIVGKQMDIAGAKWTVKDVDKKGGVVIENKAKITYTIALSGVIDYL